MSGWYVHTCASLKGLQAMRHAGVEVIRLMCFEEVRVHPKVKKRRETRKAVPALDDYVFVEAAGEADLARVAGLHKGIERMPWMGEPCPPLSRLGEEWLFNPPRGLFRDTDIARFRDTAALKCGDHVRAWTPVFAGHEGDVVAIRGRRARVQFHGAMFVTELPVDDLVLVDAADAAIERKVG